MASQLGVVTHASAVRRQTVELRVRLQILAEALKLGGPKPVDAREPSLHLVERRMIEPVVPLAPFAPLGHDTDLKHQAQVLRYGGSADGQWSGEVAHAALARLEALQQLAPDGVRKYPEDVFDRGSSRRHLGRIG